MKYQFKYQGGQALIIIAFAIIGLVGITGLAVDGSMAFSDRRHAQNAADTAAIAGAMARIEAGAQAKADPTITDDDIVAALTIAAMNMALENGYDSNPVSNTVEVYTCDMPASSCGAHYAGDPDYVQVIIESHIDTFFAGVVGIAQMHNRVQAVALANVGGDLYGGENIVALKPTCSNPGTVIVAGNTTVNLVDTDEDDLIGGLYVNTDSACGFTCNTSSGTITGDITTAGSDPTLSAHCEANITGDTSTEGTQWEFPVTLEDVGIDIPPECTSPQGTYKNYNGTYTGSDGAYYGMQLTVLTPGLYYDFPPPKLIEEGKLYDNILMLPGVYCVHDVIKLTDQNLWLIGKDVSFFIRAGYDFSINGGKITLDAPDDGDYKGYLFIVEPDYGTPLLSENPEACTINGGSENTYEGAIFAPYCNCTINGTSENNGIDSQVICYTVTISGGGTMNFSYDANKNPTISKETGLVK
jgi:hypothetical protein